MTIEVDFEDVFNDWLKGLKSWANTQSQFSRRNDVEEFVEKAIGALHGSDGAYVLIKLLHKEMPEARKLAIAELREDEVI